MNDLTVKEQAIINIIADNVFYSRIWDGTHTILNAFAPDETMHELKGKYNGIENAFTFMDLIDEDLCNELSDIYHNAVCAQRENRVTHELAKVIYFKWLTFIKEYYIKSSSNE